ncbi:class I glutamine amidotransferase-like protein [Halenospora varia]|nr:class I glutamine amidotransferase-like protein [Halenospora varia]
MAQIEVIRIAVLNCMTPIKPVFDARGPFDRMFQSLFGSAAERINTRLDLSLIKIKCISYDCTKGEYPPSLDAVDAVVITGSTASAYDGVPWVYTLIQYTQDVYTYQPHVKLFGSCFGHQILSLALLGPRGAYVEKSPHGWEVGVHTVTFTPEFIFHFPSYFEKTTNLKIQFVHADHVVIPSNSLPPGWILLGESQQCANQGLFKPGRILTFQGHAEFDTFTNGECMKLIGVQQWTEEETALAMEQVNRDDDAEIWAELAVDFLRKGNSVKI